MNKKRSSGKSGQMANRKISAPRQSPKPSWNRGGEDYTGRGTGNSVFSQSRMAKDDAEGENDNAMEEEKGMKGENDNGKKSAGEPFMELKDLLEQLKGGKKKSGDGMMGEGQGEKDGMGMKGQGQGGFGNLINLPSLSIAHNNYSI